MKITIKNTLYCISEDAKVYGKNWLTHPGFWVILSYRIRRLRKYGSKIHQFLLPIDIIVGSLRRILSDSVIPSSIPVGAGLYLPHPQGIIINHMVKIGNSVSIFQQVTLGEWYNKAPKIDDNSAIFAGAKVFGGITIGKHCKIGANVVLNANVADNTTVSVASSMTHIQSSAKH